MIKTYQVKNVKCNGCATTLKKKLEVTFGNIEVNLEVSPREITLNIDSKQEETLKIALRKIGYPLINDELSTFGKFETKTMSFVSCVIGKVDGNG